MTPNPTNLIRLFTNDRIASDSTGNPTTIWTPEETWDLGYQASIIRVFINVETIDASAIIEVTCQWSLDKKEWFDFSTTPIGSTTTAGPYTTNSNATFDFGPFVRVGISIRENTGSPTTRKTATISGAVVMRLISE